MDYRQIIQDSRGGLEKLVGKIPGYKGYKEKNLRRDADKLLRDKVAEDINAQRRRLNDQQMNLLQGGLLRFMDDMERANMKLQVLADRIKTASYGYAGLFDAVKVKEEELDQLYDFDAGLLGSIPHLTETVDKVAKAIQDQAEVGPAIQGLIEVAAAMNEMFSKREEAIMQAGQTDL